MKMSLLEAPAMPERMIQRVLALGDAWRVVSLVYHDDQKQVLIRVEESPTLWGQEQCPYCGAKTAEGCGHIPERCWRHLNLFQSQSQIVCALPRGRCKTCGKVCIVKAPWEGRGWEFTRDFEEFAVTLMGQMPLQKAGEVLGETHQRLSRIFCPNQLLNEPGVAENGDLRCQ